ncbi:MAG: FAD-binding oxidoreductase [Alphaproteobacteria bacterium]
MPSRLLPDSAIARYANNCLDAQRTILGVVQPESEPEVVQIVHAARNHTTPLYTISTGRNWGYGSSLPVASGCIILDLSRMNAIIDMDAELGVVTLQPGVTQGQLADYLNQNGLDYYVPTTGAGPSASIVGNALEHGFGLTPTEDHFLAVTSVRAVLADGNIYQSPMAEMGAAQAGVWKWGIGPYLDGLFAQSNMGIVTALQIALIKRPEHTETFVFTMKSTAQLKDMLSACRDLLIELRGPIGGIKLLNRMQLETTIGTNEMGMALAKEFPWMGIGAFRCKKSMVPAIRSEVRKTLRACCSKVVFINDHRNRAMGRAFARVPGMAGIKLRHQLGRARQLMDIVNGVPDTMALQLVYKHVKRPDGDNLHPVRDGVGVIWYAPVMPLKISVVENMLYMIGDTLKDYGFADAVSITSVHDKCMMGVIPIIYDKNKGNGQAMACYNALMEKGMELGCPPYRLNIEGMDKFAGQPDSVFWQAVANIKGVLDPSGILSPGRYAPHKHS